MIHPPADRSGQRSLVIGLATTWQRVFYKNLLCVSGVLMITNLLPNPLLAVVISLLTLPALEATAQAGQPSAAITADAPLDGCLYGVLRENKIAKGLKNVAVITDPKGAKGYEPDDVVFIFEGASFAVGNHAQEPYRVTGDVPRAAVQSGVNTAHLFVADCHTALHQRSVAVSQLKPQ
jgi:hypothetical protein